MGSNHSCCHKEAKHGAIEVVEAKAVDLHALETSNSEAHKGTGSREVAHLGVPCQVRRRSEILKEGISQPEASEPGSLRDSVASGHTIGPQMKGQKTHSAILRTTVLRVDSEIMRGIELHKSLWRFGRLWRRSPLDLKIEARSGLWEKSKPVQSYDAFLSHTWRTPGRWKVLTLLLRSSWKQILGCWILCLSVVAVLVVKDVLPLTVTIPGGALGFYANPGFSFFPWLYIASVVALPMSMALIPYLPAICRKSSICFLDVVCIHQTEEEVMHRGIYGLGGFLTKSAELWVLWSPPYFTRLWCVFEMAAFHAANPEGKIRLQPLFLEKFTVIFMFVNHALLPIQVHMDITLGLIYSGLLKSVPVLIYTHWFRKLIREKNEAIASLETFTLSEVHCRTDFDKEYIHNAIREWYGDEHIFENFVRHELREELHALSSMSLLPPQYILLMILSISAVCVDFTIGYYKFSGPFWNGWTSWLPAEPMVATFFCLTMSLPCGSFLTSNCMNYFSDRWASPLYGCNYATSCLITLIYYVMTVAYTTMNVAASSSNLWVAIAWGTVVMLLVVAQIARWHVLKARVDRKIGRGEGHPDGKAM